MLAIDGLGLESACLGYRSGTMLSVVQYFALARQALGIEMHAVNLADVRVPRQLLPQLAHGIEHRSSDLHAF